MYSYFITTTKIHFSVIKPRTDDYCWSLNRLLWTECCVQEQVIKVVIDYVCKPLRNLGYEIENRLQVYQLDIIFYLFYFIYFFSFFDIIFFKIKGYLKLAATSDFQKTQIKVLNII